MQPVPALRDFVSHFWEGRWSEAAHLNSSTYYLTASTLAGLAFAYKPAANGRPELLFASMQGQTSLHGQFPSGGFLELFGVSLYAYAIPALLNMPATELNNRFTEVDLLLSKGGRILTAQMAEATTMEKRVGVLTEFFLTQLRKSTFADSMVVGASRLIREQSGVLNISELSAECCLSQKQFERRFKTGTGFNPKLYARIVRFENVLNNRQLYNSLTEASYVHGFYDQAHFINEFKTFSGYSPGKFFSLAGY